MGHTSGKSVRSCYVFYGDIYVSMFNDDDSTKLNKIYHHFHH